MAANRNLRTITHMDAAAPRRLATGELVREALAFRDRLDAVKARVRREAWNWYPYGSLNNFFPIEKLLAGAGWDLYDLTGSGPVADIGCADGELAFFLESLGCQVAAIDQPSTSHNGMRGLRALKSALRSSLEIVETDLDAGQALPPRIYSVVFFLGVLYHLKNPFLALETLARHARYCFVSTRITALAPDRRARLEPWPVAYLLGEREANNDPTNYWIFTENGLRRLLDRAGWDVCGLVQTGNTSSPDPSSAQGDGRAFGLLRSRRLRDVGPRAVDAGNPIFAARLGPAWHPIENGFRWMPRRATLHLPGPQAPEERLYLRGYAPAMQLRGGPVRLSLSIAGHALPPVVLTEPESEFAFDFALPPELVGRPAVEVTIEADRTFTPPGEQRELGAAFGIFEIA